MIREAKHSHFEPMTDTSDCSVNTYVDTEYPDDTSAFHSNAKIWVNDPLVTRIKSLAQNIKS